MKTKTPAFEKGQTVTFKFGAAGINTKKLGLVVGHVPPGEFPNQKYGKHGFKPAEHERHRRTTGRLHRSFVVLDLKTGKLHWPLVKYLKPKS